MNFIRLIHRLIDEMLIFARFFFSMKFQSSGSFELQLIILPILELVSSFILVFLTCEVIGRITTEFEEVNEIIDQFAWYLFPLKVQQMLPMIMIHAQESVEIDCFGSTPTDRETFKKVQIKQIVHLFLKHKLILLCFGISLFFLIR